MESLMASLGSSDGMDISKLMSMAASMASSLTSEMDTDEKDDIKNMSADDQVKKVTEKVMNMMRSFDDSPKIEDADTDDIRISMDITVADIVSGITNRKLKYKRLVKGKSEMAKEKVFITVDPMTFKKELIFKKKGDNVGDLIVSLNVKSTPTLSLDRDNNLTVRHLKLPTIVHSKMTIADGVDIELEPSDVTTVSFRLLNKGLILSDGSRSDIIVNCCEL